MSHLTHADQQERWDREHQKPTILLQIDADTVSSSVQRFYRWLQAANIKMPLSGIEMCCGKGRNSIWLAGQGMTMIGIDYSKAAIAAAKRRARKAGVTKRATFLFHDATKPYDLPPESLNFAIDCFGSTDIETAHGRKKAFNNIKRLLKPGGLMMIYLLSTEDEYAQELLQKYPGPDIGSYINAGMYEKAFSEQEIKELYTGMELLTLERIPKRTTFFEREYSNCYIWAVFQKPLKSNG